MNTGRGVTGRDMQVAGRLRARAGLGRCLVKSG